jgi:hypothetical protein
MTMNQGQRGIVLMSIAAAGFALLVIAAKNGLADSKVSDTANSTKVVDNGLKAYPKFWNYMSHNARGYPMFCDRPGKYSCPLSGNGWKLDSYENRHVLCVSVYDPADFGAKSRARQGA